MGSPNQCYSCLWFQRGIGALYKRCQLSSIQTTLEGQCSEKRYFAIFPDVCEVSEPKPDVSGLSEA